MPRMEITEFFSLNAPGNDSYMCASVGKLLIDGVPACVACGYKIDLYFINPAFRVKRRNYDLSCTYDGYKIASLKFIEACKRFDLIGLSYLPLPADKDFVVLKAHSVTRFDAVSRKTHFERLCAVCGKYESVTGAHPVFLLEQPATDLSATDIAFGSGNSKSQILLASKFARTLLAGERLTGLEFERAIGGA